MSIITLNTRIMRNLARAVLMASICIRRPGKRVEVWLDLQLSAEDHDSLQTAIQEENAKLGDYYRIYAEKKWIASALRGFDRTRLLCIARSIDQTDYSLLTSTLKHGKGAVIALPHYGHYIISAINLMDHVRERRDVFMLYGSPKNHPGNELFDVLSPILFGERNSGAQVLHSDARGLATALRALRAGAVVITMPDVCPDEHHAFMIPFLKRQLEIPLGTASLARRSGAALIPAISCCEGTLRVRTIFGCHVQTETPRQSERQECSQANDYRSTMEMFDFFESVIKDNPLHWQYVIQHYGSGSSFPTSEPSELEATWQYLQASNPLLRNRDIAIALDTQDAWQ